MRKFKTLKTTVLAVAFVIMAAVLVPSGMVQAAGKVKIKNESVAMKKAATSKTYLGKGTQTFYLYMNQYYYPAKLVTNSSGKIVMTYTKNGKKYSGYNVEDALRKKLSGITSKDVLKIQGITRLNNQYMMYGYYGAAGSATSANQTAFVAVTKNFKTYTVQKLPTFVETPVGGVATTKFFSPDVDYVNGTYIYHSYTLPNDTAVSNQGYYYTSKDLKTWTKRTTPVSAQKGSWGMECTTDKGAVFVSRVAKSEVYTSLTVPGKYYFTSDFKKYSDYGAPSSPAGTNYASGYSYLDTTQNKFMKTAVNYNYASGKYQFKGLFVQKSTAKNYKKFSTVFKYTKSDYKSYTSFSKTTKEFSYGITKKNGKSSIFCTKNGKTFKEYTTSLNLSKISSRIGVNGYIVAVYNGNTLLLSNDCFKTIYKLKMPVKNIQSVQFVKNRIVVNAPSGNYYFDFLKFRDKIEPKPEEEKTATTKS